MRLAILLVTLLSFTASTAGAAVQVSASIAGEDSRQTKYNVTIANTGARRAQRLFRTR